MGLSKPQVLAQTSFLSFKCHSICVNNILSKMDNVYKHSEIKQINKPQKQVSSHHKYQDNRPKKRPVSRYSDDEGDENAEAFSMLRSLFK